MPSLKKPDTSQFAGTPSHWPTGEWATPIQRSSGSPQGIVTEVQRISGIIFIQMLFSLLQTKEIKTCLFPVRYTVMVGKSNIQNAGKQVPSFHS